MTSGHFEAILSSLAPLLAKLANCPEGFLGWPVARSTSIFDAPLVRAARCERADNRLDNAQRASAHGKRMFCFDD